MKLWSTRISGRNRFLKSLLLNMSVVILVIWGVGIWHSRNLLPTGSDDRAPDFELNGIDGRSYGLHRSEGTVFLYFFAPWCSVCKISISNLNDLPSETDQKQVHVYAVALDWKSIAEVEHFISKQDLEVPVLMGTRDTAKDFRIQAFPTYYVLDDTKRIMHRNVGYSTSMGIRWNFAKARAGGFGFQFLQFLFE